AYMSPEQFSGVEVGAASDQFSFCVALYEALFASRPFAGETIASLSASVLQGELSPPPRGHGVPTPIVRAIERGLATTPQDRFPSMRALRAALARELAPRRTAWAVGGLLTALLTGGGAAMALQPAAAPAPEDPCAGAEQALDDVWTGARGDALERRVAELNAPTALRLVGALRGELDAYAGAWTAMRRDACEDTHVRGEQSERLLDLRVACLDRHKLRLATLTEALAEEPDAALLERAVDVSHELGALEACADRGYLMNARGPAIAAELPPSERARFEATAAALERGWVLWRLGRHAQAATLAASALEAADALAQPWLTARALRLSGDVSEVTGKYDDAAAAFDRAVWAGVSAGDQESVAFALLSYADVSGLRRKDVAAARQALDRLEPLLAVVPSGPELRARALLVRGRVALAAGDDEEARALLEQALPALTAQLGEGHSITVNAAQELANALVHLGEHAAAVERFSQIIAAIAERHGEAHPQVISALTSRGVARGWLGQFAEGRADLERALELSRELHGARHPSVADALHNLGELHWKRRDYARAREYHAENLALRREVLDPGDPYIGFTLVSLGEIDLVTHEHARALAELQEARGIIEPRLGPDHPVTAFVDTRIAQVRLALGQRALAVPALEASLATLERGSNLEWRADAEFALARGLDERDRDRAVALARAALARYREVGDRTAAVQAEVSTWLEEHVD
ncbi:MAG: tetratricopeptide repeat protein, partial [Myxococcales bacterium]|nr:tetratricopeptide repeat protein [Myxococcales bacterium]